MDGVRWLRMGGKEEARKEDRGEVLLFSLNIKFSICMMLRSTAYFDT